MFSKLATVGAFAAAVVAQSNVITFTSVPSSFTNGEAANIEYSSSNTAAPITILLRQGPSTNLQTVQTITSNAADGEVDFTPDCLPNGSDYALEITQAGEVNYFGPFSISGYDASACGSSSSSASAPAYSTSASTYPVSSSVPVPTAYSKLVTSKITTSLNTTVIIPYPTGGPSASGYPVPSGNGSYVAPTTKPGAPYPVPSGTVPGGAVPTVSGPAINGAPSVAGSSSLALAFGALVAALFLH